MKSLKEMFRLLMMVSLLTVTNIAVIPAIIGTTTEAYSQLPTSAPSLDKLKTQTKSFIEIIWDIAKWVLGIVLIISLIFVVWMVSQNHPKSKEAVIGWIVGVGLYAIGIALIS